MQISGKYLQRVALSSTRQLHIASIGKPKVVVIGCGWAGFRFAQDIDKSKYHVTLVSPRNHFLFTPLLPSTAVGTLEFRCIQEPVRTIPGLHYDQASCNSIDYKTKKLHCTDAFKNEPFVMDYDYLVLAPGSETNTFNVPGVQGNPRIFFLNQLIEARKIRNKLIENFERASIPSTSDADRRRLLTFVVVGGGPTNVEFASELHDFLNKDVARSYSDLLPYVRVVVVEATGHILGSFSSSLVDYVEKLFLSRNIDVRANTTVKAIEHDNIAVLGNGSKIPFGLMVWATGIKQVPLVRSIAAEIAHNPGGRLLVDERLRVLAASEKYKRDPTAATYGEPIGDGSIYAMGDCACDSVKPLPALAQVAAQQAKYLAKVMNTYPNLFPPSPPTPAPPSSTAAATSTSTSTSVSRDMSVVPAFKYMHLGSMASVGDWKGIVDTPKIDNHETPPVKGFLAFLLWRAAYWTKSVSWSNKMLIPMYWFKSMVFGRDISRF